MNMRRTIEQSILKTARSFGYSEIATPTFELAELFIKKSGPEIVEQLYLFRDKGDRELVLRPELTAPAIRFYANDLYKLPKPLKIFYLGDCFRYERPQKGRFREFRQFGAELIGTARPEGIAELINLACSCLSSAGLENFQLRVGDLKILNKILAAWDIFGDDQRRFFTALDKGDSESVRLILEDSGRSPDDVETFFDLIQNKVNSEKFNERKDLLLSKFPELASDLERFEKVVEFLKILKVSNFTIDFGIARGLDYYTGIVFEIDVESLGAEKQVCGGGEYSLNELFNLKELTSSGFAIGFDRVVLAAENEGVVTTKEDLDIFIISLTPPGLQKGMELAGVLRQAGFKVEFDIKGRNMSKNLKFASGKGAKFALFLGNDELEKGSALIRQMTTGEQTEIKFDNVSEYFKEHIV
jgi:histidyl-tRNA synthetase